MIKQVMLKEKKMRKIAAIFAAALITGGCVNGKFVSESTTNSCDGQGWTHTIVHYGDSRAMVIPLSDVARGEEFRFYLVPQVKGKGAQDWSNATVRAVSKGGWFDPVQGDASDRYISTCVSDSVSKGDILEYKIEVYLPPSNVEPPPAADLKILLDPRAVVIKN